MLEMYKCLDCGHYFAEPDELVEVDGDIVIWSVCPLCQCKEIKPVTMVESDKLTKEQAIEHIEDVMTILRTRHMCRTWDDDITKEEIDIYKKRFQALKMAIEVLREVENAKIQKKASCD